MESLFRQFGDLDPAIREQLLNTVVLLAVLLGGRWLALRLVLTQVDDPEARYRWRKGLTYATAILTVILVGWIWSSGVARLGTFLGLLTAALAIALREPVTNFAGWIFILWRRPFKLGDRVQISGHAGDVVDIRVFQFSLMEIGNWVKAEQPTGRIVHIPNGKVFTEPQANYDSAFPFIWNEVPVLITFESDWRAAKRLLEEIVTRRALPADEVTERLQTSAYAITRMAGAPAVITTVESSGVLLTLRYLCNPRQRRATTEAIWEDVLAAFGERDDIDFAYPTTRFYENPVEGKPDARATP